MLVGMWRKPSHTKAEQAAPGHPAGEQPFKPAYIPMHGPGAKPLEKPDTGWHPGPKQKAAIVIALALVLGTGGFFISSANSGKSSASPESITFGSPGDSDESTVLGADSYRVPNSFDGSGTAGTSAPGPTGAVNTSGNTAGLAINPRGTTRTAPAPAPKPGTASPAPSPSPQPAPAPTPGPVTTPTPVPPPAPQPTSHTVEYAGGGFKTTALMIQKGDSVTFVHKGNQEPFQPGCTGGSPVSCQAPGLLAANESWTYIFSTPGTYTIQNVQVPAESMTITVAE